MSNKGKDIRPGMAQDVVSLLWYKPKESQWVIKTFEGNHKIDFGHLSDNCKLLKEESINDELIEAWFG